ncbi:hypothetical protein N658DRAFT_493768 [Parathielavia hyrcaniae]|uniref:Uncharacterized protein n=1 Tax=Parathielavia hyrcaniae TaxID=113614 RepID=A0AAN6Q647_9PEZI|nr:hypothetical protein N658DRAFT_493768 [Parathielavia hyrcaniae]
MADVTPYLSVHCTPAQSFLEPGPPQPRPWVSADGSSSNLPPVFSFVRFGVVESPGSTPEGCCGLGTARGLMDSITLGDAGVQACQRGPRSFEEWLASLLGQDETTTTFGFFSSLFFSRNHHLCRLQTTQPTLANMVDAGRKVAPGFATGLPCHPCHTMPCHPLQAGERGHVGDLLLSLRSPATPRLGLSVLRTACAHRSGPSVELGMQHTSHLPSADPIPISAPDFPGTRLSVKPNGSLGSGSVGFSPFGGWRVGC